MDDLSSDPRPVARRRLPGGFTLIELLVVMGIIVLLFTLAAAGLVYARKQAVKTRMAADLQVLSQGLDAYRADFKDYPRIDYVGINANNSGTNISKTSDRLGAIVLCWALLSPGPATGTGSDGADGAGFRIRGTQGQVWGPYIQPGRFSVSGTTNLDSTINDAFGNPYLYFPLNKAAGPTNGNMYVETAGPGVVPAYNTADNTVLVYTNPTPGFPDHSKDMKLLLGADPATGLIKQGKIPITLPYLLWGAGQDEIFGINPKYGKSDDVTNFDLPADLRQ